MEQPHKPTEDDRRQHYDVLVVGGGVLGISASYHLQTLAPTKTFAVLEKNKTIGGTWEHWQYPG